MRYTKKNLVKAINKELKKNLNISIKSNGLKRLLFEYIDNNQ